MAHAPRCARTVDVAISDRLERRVFIESDRRRASTGTPLDGSCAVSPTGLA
jgi:hypothetical protein